MCIFLFQSIDIIISTLTKNTLKKLKFKKELKIKNFPTATNLFLPKIVNNLFSINDFFLKIKFSCSS